MLDTELVRKALSVAQSAHKKQKDRGGRPYIEHPMAVAENQTKEDATVAALLHDVVEDSKLSLEDLYAEPNSFPLSIVLAVQRLTHFPADVPYMKYIKQIQYNIIAREVKPADLKHNMDLSRLKKPPKDADFERVKKYQKALELLQASAAKGGNIAPSHNGLFADVPLLGSLYFRDIYQWKNRPKLFSCVGKEEQPYIMVMLREGAGFDAEWLAIATPLGLLEQIERESNPSEQIALVEAAIVSKYTLCFIVSRSDDKWQTVWLPGAETHIEW